MTDRLPGAPGRYSGVIDAEQLQKLHKSEPFAITLTRDDQPVREGTPYSKAAVLPDDVAQLLCPEAADPTPADAFRRLGDGKLGTSKDAFAARVSSFDGYKDSNGDLVEQVGCRVYRLMMEENEKLYGKTVRIKTYAYGGMVYGWHCHGEYIPINPNADIAEKPKSGIREFEVTFPEYNPDDVYEIFDVCFCENPYTGFEIYEKKGTVWEELKKLQSVEGYDAFVSVLTSVKYEKQYLTPAQQTQVRENIGFADAVRDVVDSPLGELKLFSNELEDSSSIVCEESGSSVFVSDASNRKLKGLVLYGKTTQNGTPTPAAPVEFVNAGAKGTITVSVTDGTEENVQIATVATPNGLCGIPTYTTAQASLENATYVDENGTHWICDEIDFERGVHIQRIGTVDMGDLPWTYASSTKNFYTAISGHLRNVNHYVLCDSYETVYSNADYKEGDKVIIHAYYQLSDRRINVKDSDYTDAEAFKAAVAGKKIMYVLAKPVETPLTEDALATYAALHTNKPDTVAFSDDNAGIAMEYVADTKLYIDNKFTELKNAILSAGANV